MEKWMDFLNKNVKIIFEDGENHFSKKEGLLVEVNNTHLVLRVLNYDGDKHEGYNLNKILRIEEVDIL